MVFVCVEPEPYLSNTLLLTSSLNSNLSSFMQLSGEVTYVCKIVFNIFSMFLFYLQQFNKCNVN